MYTWKVILAYNKWIVKGKDLGSKGRRCIARELEDSDWPRHLLHEIWDVTLLQIKKISQPLGQHRGVLRPTFPYCQEFPAIFPQSGVEPPRSTRAQPRVAALQ